MSEKTYQVPAKTLVGVLNYLGERPFKEVSAMLTALMALIEKQNVEVKEGSKDGQSESSSFPA